MVVILIASLGAGACLAYWLSSRNAVFDKYQDLSIIANVAIAGIVTHAWMETARAQHRRELTLFSLGTAGLFFCLALLLLI